MTGDVTAYLPQETLMVTFNSTEEYCNAEAVLVLGIEFPRRMKPEFLQAENMFIRSLVLLIFKCNIYFLSFP
jgi:hypothetical protein